MHQLAGDRHDVGILTSATVGKVENSYRKTHDFDGSFIDDFHRSLAYLPIDQRGKPAFPFDFANPVSTGWQSKRLTDYAKLYELAYFARENVIDLGTAEGASSYVMSQALSASGNSNSVFTVELKERQIAKAKANLARFGHCSNVVFNQASGHVFLEDGVASDRRCDLVFIDHCHEFEETALTCALLHRVLSVGGMALFHDYNDGRNFDPQNTEYNVVRGIEVGLDWQHFRPIGVFGSTGLFKRYA